MKLTRHLQIIVILILGVGWGAGCTSQKVLSSYSDTKSESKLEKCDTSFEAQSIHVSETVPPLYHFISNSDYVITAWVAENRPKQPSKNLFSGTIYTFRVEKVHYAKPGLGDSPLNKNNLEDFHIYRPSGLDSRDPSYFYSVGHRYLIFLQKHPEQEELIKKYELPKGKTYYRAFRSETEHLSRTPPAGSKGIIDLADTKYQDLVQQIQTFCEAFNEPSKKLRLKNLRQLAKSENRVVKQNAIYALEVLNSDEHQQ